MANVGERWRTISGKVKYGADDGERPRTFENEGTTVLKTTKVQAFGGSNPSPSATPCCGSAAVPASPAARSIGGPAEQPMLGGRTRHVSKFTGEHLLLVAVLSFGGP